MVLASGANLRSWIKQAFSHLIVPVGNLMRYVLNPPEPAACVSTQAYSIPIYLKMQKVGRAQLVLLSAFTLGFFLRHLLRNSSSKFIVDPNKVARQLKDGSDIDEYDIIIVGGGAQLKSEFHWGLIFIRNGRLCSCCTTFRGSKCPCLSSGSRGKVC